MTKKRDDEEIKKKREAAAIASQEHYERMIRAGYKKYSLFIKTETMAGIDRIVDMSEETTRYQLIDKILKDYVEAFMKK